MGLTHKAKRRRKKERYKRLADNKWLKYKPRRRDEEK